MAKYHLVRYYPENEFLLRIAKGDEVSCFMTAIMRHCSDEQRIHIRDMLIERTPKDTKKEKEIAELVGALKQIFEQYGYECKNYADSCGISFEKWVLDIPTYQTVKQILKKHNP